MTKLQVKKSKIAGKGLFTTKNILKGEIIIAMKQPIEITQITKIAQFPSDAAIFVYKTKKYIIDKQWTNPKIPPFWYFQNHATTEANSKMILTQSKIGPSISWVAKKDINKGSEIMFNYNPGKTLCFS